MTINEFLKDDRFAALTGIELVKAGPGLVNAQLRAKAIHLNAAGVVQGGAIFTLADFAFAALANSYGNLSVSVESSIRFLRKAEKGLLTAMARTVSINSKLITIHVDVIDEAGNLIAFFTSTGYRKNVPLNFDPPSFESLT